MTLLFLGKQNDPHCARAAEFAARNFDARIVLGKRGEPIPDDVLAWQGDWLVSYLCPWVVPAALLSRARRAAINFHPGPPEYPGIGCTNFAIYDGVAEFGVTCHHMAAAVDTGKMIAVRRFAVLPTDTVLSITERCYAHILTLFYDVASAMAAGQPLPTSSEVWTRRPFKRAELNELCRLTREMSDDEWARRIKAVTYPGMPGAFIEIHGKRYAVREEEPK